MRSKYVNPNDISLSMAVFLADDLYEHNDDPNTISVTSLIKPIKQVLLSQRVNVKDSPIDVLSVYKAQCGTAVHTAVEDTWKHRYTKAMRDLGFEEDIIAMVRINPTPKEVAEAKANNVTIAPVYLEQRSKKTVDGITVSGQFDLVMDGVLEDIKNTSTYTYIKKTNDRYYQLQGSIYRWLNPNIIKADFMRIQFCFTDWSAMGLKRDPRNYPPLPQLKYEVPLMSLKETETYVTERIAMIKKLRDAEETEMPPCTDEELWKDPSVWKYYKSGKVTTRSTKNFDNPDEAYARLAADGNVGIVKEIRGVAKACNYCNAFPVCLQKDTEILT